MIRQDYAHSVTCNTTSALDGIKSLFLLLLDWLGRLCDSQEYTAFTPNWRFLAFDFKKDTGECNFTVPHLWNALAPLRSLSGLPHVFLNKTYKHNCLTHWQFGLKLSFSVHLTQQVIKTLRFCFSTQFHSHCVHVFKKNTNIGFYWSSTPLHLPCTDRWLWFTLQHTTVADCYGLFEYYHLMQLF